jgi:Xaa-Pro aminopeptidase
MTYRLVPAAGISSRILRLQQELAGTSLNGALILDGINMFYYTGTIQNGFGSNQVSFLGHGLGLAIDEFPAIARKVHFPLQRNMVIALEPKKGLKDIGLVGVENTFLVTAQGGEKLTPGSDEITIL